MMVSQQSNQDDYVASCRQLIEGLPFGKKVNPGVWSIRLSGRRALVLRGRTEEITAGGIIIPPSAQRPIATGWVLLTGPEFGQSRMQDERSPSFFDLFDQPEQVIGKKVLYGDYTGQEIHFSNRGTDYDGEYLLLQEWELWGYEKESNE